MRHGFYVYSFLFVFRIAFLKHTSLEFFARFYLKMAVLEGAIKSHRYDKQEINILISYYLYIFNRSTVRHDSLRNKAVNH